MSATYELKGHAPSTEARAAVLRAYRFQRECGSDPMLAMLLVHANARGRYCSTAAQEARSEFEAFWANRYLQIITVRVQCGEDWWWKACLASLPE